MLNQKYPLEWEKGNLSINIFCSIPNIATGILLRPSNAKFIVDPGDGILRDLNNEIGTDGILEISDIFITHGHHDHVGGVWSLLTYLRVMRKKSSVSIYYPKGCIEIETIHNAFMQVYGSNLSYEIKLIEIKDQTSLQSSQVTITPFEVLHKDYSEDGSPRRVPALGYKFTFEDKSICYGGDTAWCESLVDMAKDSDLAIIEAGHEDDTPDEMHMSMEEAKQIGKSAKEYFLVHVPE